MTGYARAEGEEQGLSWAWEVKSVNGRGLELRNRVPPGFDSLELPARDLVQKRLARGSVSLGLNLKRETAPGRLAFNEATFSRYVELARLWQQRLPDFGPASLDGLLALKGVFEAEETADPAVEDHAKTILATLTKALDALCAMRASEGARLGGILGGLLDEIAALVAQARGSQALDPVRVREKLRGQLAELLGATPPIAEERLAQEAALLATKGDPREELDRLVAHVGAARELLASGEAVGRRLDFLCQEFNREANTFCAKASDLELTRIGLALKAKIEQFREQVQNVE